MTASTVQWEQVAGVGPRAVEKLPVRPTPPLLKKWLPLVSKTDKMAVAKAPNSRLQNGSSQSNG